MLRVSAVAARRVLASVAAALLLALAVPSRASALERPTGEEIAQYQKDGSLQQRIQQVSVGGRFSGTVRDTTGAPLANVGVTVYSSIGNYVQQVTTDASGAYFANALPPGTYHARTSNQLAYIDRVLDTRTAGGALPAAQEKLAAVGGQCGISLSANAAAMNVTVTGPTALGHLTVYPEGGSRPLASTINFRPGQTRANNAVVPLGGQGRVRIFSGQASGAVRVIVDVTGYFE